MKVAIGIALAVLAAGCSNAGSGPANKMAATDRMTDQAKAPPGAVEKRVFEGRYTTGGLKPCKIVEKNEEEGPYYRHLCPGVGGFNYEIVESDLRQHLVIIGPDKKRNEIDTYAVGGGGFSSFGPTMEWRGLKGLKPSTLTARLNVQNGETEKDVSYLIVVRLFSPSCILAIIPPGPGQNDKARAITDGRQLPHCAVPLPVQ